MTTVKNTSSKTDERTRTVRTPRVSLNSARWTSRPGAPRLVTFSWGAVVPSMTRR